MSITNSTTFSTIILSSVNFLDWFQMVKSYAQAYQIWEFVDPQSVKTCNEPERPVPENYATGASSIIDLSPDEKELFKEDRIDYRLQISRYDTKQVALANLRTKIIESLPPAHRTMTYDCETVRDVLKQLVTRIKPTSDVQRVKLLDEYVQLCRGTTAKKVDEWLLQWERLVSDLNRLKLVEFDNTKVTKDFLDSARTLMPEFVISYRIAARSSGNTLDFWETVREFRDTYHEVAVQEKSAKHEVFTTSSFQGEKQENVQNRAETKDSRPIPKCQCGVQHWYKDCPYISKQAQSKDWKPDSKIVAAIKEKILSSDSSEHPSFKYTRSNIEKKATTHWLIDWLRSNPKQTDTGRNQTESSSEPNPTGFMLSAQDTTHHELRNSFILDSGATSHFCNDLSRVIGRLQPAGPDDFVQTGSNQLEIIGYGDILVQGWISHIKTQPFLLRRVAIVPDLFLSVISWRVAKQKGGKWDTTLDTLSQDRILLSNIRNIRGQFVIEHSQTGTTGNKPLQVDSPTQRIDGTESSQTIVMEHSQTGTASNNSQQAESSSSGQSPSNYNFALLPAETWHKRLAHCGKDVIETIRKSGVPMKGKGPVTQECETCALNKAHRIISRQPPQRAMACFERIHFDIIQFPLGFDGNRYILHFIDDKSRMNFVYLLTNKNASSILTSLKQFATYCYRQFQKKIKIFHSDQDPGLGNHYNDWISDEGYRLEWSAVYTPEQNGSAERSGGVIEMKARCLGNGAKLPIDLWPEFAIAAGYLLNRTPTKQLDWKSPFEYLRIDLGQPPKDELSHLKVYGCKAYPRVPNIPKGNKMDERAEVGYLMGYESRNIFRIWLPEKWEVIATRDVIFDETSSYDPKRNESLLATGETEVINHFIPLDLPRSGFEHNDLPFNEREDEFNEPSTFNEPTKGKELSKQDQEQQQLPTPRLTEEPGNSPQQVETDSFTHQPLPGPIRRPRNEGLSTSNIISTQRTRAPRSLNFLTESDSYTPYQAFLTDIKPNQSRIHRSQLPPIPKNWKAMISHPHADQFHQATRSEYKALESQGTFEEVEYTDRIKPIPLKWVFTYKLDSDGFLLKHKARICVRGDLQQMTNEDTYAATLAYKTFRTLMALTATFGYETKQLDAVNAFLNADLDELVYCYYPPGFTKTRMCLRLKKALYGLRKSPRLWLNLLGSTLSRLGLHPVPGQPCIYTTYDGIIFFFYVDDIGVIYLATKQAETVRIISELMKQFEFRELGEINWFLGIRIIRDRNQHMIWLCQDAYIERIAKAFNCNELNQIDSPLNTDRMLPSTTTATSEAIHLYKSKVGSIQFATTVSRPDAARAASHLAEFMIKPSQEHHNAADRTIGYLYQTRFLALQYGGTDCNGLLQMKTIDASADASFASTADRKSIQGYVFKLFGGPIHWGSTKQDTVTTSSTEAELLSVSQASKELIWIFNFFKSIRFDTGGSIQLQNDNQQTIRLLTNTDPGMSTKLKHVDIHHHWLRERIQREEISILWVPTAEMTADGMTKALPPQKHARFIEQLGLTSCYHLMQSVTA